MAAGVSYQEVTAKSALNRSTGLRLRWTLNPYRGCVHSCQYCYARATHSYLDLDSDRDFERIIFAKVNLPELLSRELRRPSWKGESVAIGTAADPYQPAEGRYRITRRSLEVFADLANPCSILTKGTLILRDVDVLQHLATRARFGVGFSLSTVDEQLARRLEPGAPSPRARLRALERLRAAGVPAGVLLCPILPGLTDSPRQLEEAVRAAAAHGAVAVEAGALRLAPLVRDHFVRYVEREFPHLAAAYQRAFASRADAPRAYRERLGRRMASLKAACGIAAPANAETPTALEVQQMNLPL